MFMATLLRGMGRRVRLAVRTSQVICQVGLVALGAYRGYAALVTSPSSMKSVNTVTLLGNVARDPELKKSKAGSVCTFGMATNRVWKDSAGQKQSLPEFHSIVAWGPLAEFCAEYVQKGNPLFVQGYLKTTSWEGKHGEMQYRTEIVLDDLTLLGKKKAEEEVAEESQLSA